MRSSGVAELVAIACASFRCGAEFPCAGLLCLSLSLSSLSFSLSLTLRCFISCVGILCVALWAPNVTHRSTRRVCLARRQALAPKILKHRAPQDGTWMAVVALRQMPIVAIACGDLRRGLSTLLSA